jgi:hypothetical protein
VLSARSVHLPIPAEPDKNKRTLMLGLRPCIFWIVIIVLAIVVIGASVGGAVGGRKALEGHSQNEGPRIATTTLSTATSATGFTTTSATLTPAPTPTTDCPRSNNTTYRSKFLSGDNGPVGSSAQLVFTKSCDARYSSGFIAQSYVYSFDDCIELCASLNFWANNGDCIGASYEAEGSPPGNCWAHRRGADLMSTGDKNMAFLSQ